MVERTGVGVEVEDNEGGKGWRVERTKVREEGGREVRWERKGARQGGGVVGSGWRFGC